MKISVLVLVVMGLLVPGVMAGDASTHDAVYRSIRDAFGMADVAVVTEEVDGQTLFITEPLWCGSTVDYCAETILPNGCTDDKDACKKMTENMCAKAGHKGTVTEVEVRSHLDGSKTCSAKCAGGSGAQAYCISRPNTSIDKEGDEPVTVREAFGTGVDEDS